MICTNCGQKLPEDSRFCEYCGAQVSVELPKIEVVHQPSNQQGSPGVVTGGGGMRREEISMNQPEAKKPAKSLVWVVLIVLVCSCIAVIGGGFVYLRIQGQSSQDVDPGGLEEITGVPEVSIRTPIPEEAVQPIPQVETAELQNDLPPENIMVVTSSGIWVVNEKTHKAVQISFDQVDAPDWDPMEGLSPDKKFFAFITGFGGASVNPMLIVLDVENQVSLMQLELTGPIIQAGQEGTHGDPAFEAFGAMQFTDSLAWSPDGNRLAFVAARDGDGADIYLFDRADSSVIRLTDEVGNATALHWSPNGQLLQYLSVNAFGTGAGFNMEGLWVYDFKSKKAQLLETLDSNGEEFLAWMDNSRFLISSSSRTCGGAYNLRIVDAISSDQQVILASGFTAAAYDPENKFGMISIAYNYDNCSSGEPLDVGLMIFGESVPVLGADGPITGAIGLKKFEQVIAYDIGFNPQGNLFTVYSEEGQLIYYKDKYGYNKLNILPEVKGFTPKPSPAGDYWAWASRVKAGLWITKDNSHPVELSSLFSGVPLWGQDGQTIYFFEKNRLFSASAPQFNGELLMEIPGQEIQALIK